MTKRTLSELIEHYRVRAGHSYGKIAKESVKFSPTGTIELPKSTVNNWVKSNSQTLPRKPLILLARIFELTESEANELFSASRHPDTRRQLRTEKDPYLRDLLAHWDHTGQAFQPPREPAWFIGRQSIRERIKNILLHSKHRLCFVYGEGGVGKSQLAIRASHELRSYFPDGVLWGEVNGDASIMSILRSFASCFDFQLDSQATAAQCSEQVRSLLQTKKCLIVLDDIATMEELQLLLPAEGSCSVLITLRDRELAREFYRGEAIKLDRFELAESRELLNLLLGEQRVQAELTAVNDLINFSEGHPLVTQLIGSALRRTESISLGGYAELLRSKLVELKDWELYSDKNRKVRATFEISFQRLLPKVQQIFQSLGVFQASHFSLDAVAHMNQLDPDETRLLLAHLCDLSLIQHSEILNEEVRDALRERYRMHNLLQLFAAEKEKTAGSNSLKEAEIYFQQFVENENGAAIDVDWVNIESFLNDGLNHDDIGGVKRLILPLTQIEIGRIGYMDTRGHYQTAYKALKTIVEHTADEELPDHEKAMLHYRCGVFAHRLSHDNRQIGNMADLLKHLPQLESDPVNNSPDNRWWRIALTHFKTSLHLLKGGTR